MSYFVTSTNPIAIEHQPLSQIKPDPTNPRVHKDRQIKALVKSIRSFGFNIPIAIDRDGKILAGHARFEAAKKLGMTSVPIIRLDHLSPAQAKAFMIADNRLSEMSSWSDALLAVQLQELAVLNLDFDLEATGFSMGEIDLRLEAHSDEESEDLEEPLPELPKGPPVTSLGDLWLLGDHRLLCGNALQASDLQLVFDGKKAGMVITDPPYNVKIDGHVGGKGRIKHAEFAMACGEMSSEQFTTFLQMVFQNLMTVSKAGSVQAIFMDWRHLPEILSAGNQTYGTLLNLCVWVKSNAGMGSLYRSQHELCLIFKNGKEAHQNNIQLGRFGRYRTNVWNYAGISAMRHSEEGDLLKLHPTVKPIQMVADAILDCSKRNDIIADPFLGSGTTLLAAQRVGRRCYALELDPRYVDTAIVRWQQHTGSEAIHVKTGQTFTQMQASRRVGLTQQEVNHVL